MGKRGGNVHYSLRATRLLARAPGKHTDHVRAELREDRLERPPESGAIRQQKHDRRDPPGHANDRDGRTAAVVPHRLHRLSKDISQHRVTPSATLRRAAASPPG